MKKLIILIVFLSVIYAPLNSAVIFEVDDFDDPSAWVVTTSSSGSSNIISSVTGSEIAVGRDSGTGGARLTLNLSAPISTIGFENITLGFRLNSADSLEWNGNLANIVNSTDGFRVLGDGVNINANSVNDITGTVAETEIIGGVQVQSETEGSLGSTSFVNADFSFDASVDNSAITQLELILQINANPETLVLSGLTVSGDPIPEPTACLLLVCGGATLLCRRKRQR